MDDEIKLPVLHRLAEIKLCPKQQARAATSADDGDGPDQEPDDDEVELTFSSEEPYERYFGMEILGHKDNEVDLGWMASGRAPLLVDHNPTVDSQIGTLSKVWLEDGKGKAIARFGKNARAQEIAERVKAGDLTNVSVGYRVLEMELVSTKKDGPDSYRVTRWQPMEASIVAIPADPTVGVGRSTEGLQAVRISKPNQSQTVQVKGPSKMEVENNQNQQPPMNLEAMRAAEHKRMQDIAALGARFNKRDLADKAMADGSSIETFRGQLLDVVGGETYAEKNQNANTLGLSKKEAQGFRFTNLISGMAGRHLNDAAMKKQGSFELEVIDASTAKRGVSARGGVHVPIDVLRQSVLENTRALNIGTAAQGGNTMQTDLLEQDFITVLRNRMATNRMGARILTGLEGNFNIPRHTTPGVLNWVAEATNTTGSTQAFDQISFSPKTASANTDISRRMLLQSSLDAESFVRDDLTQVLALGIDAVALNGTGGTQPLGLAGQTGLNVIALGANGAIPAWADIINMETQVANSNADLGNLGYLTTPKMRGKMKGVLKAAAASSDFIWQGTGTSEGFGDMNGYKAFASNQVLSNLTKGTSAGICSQIFFGNWSDLLIAQWSGIDLLIDPNSLSMQASVRVVAFVDLDVGVRHGQSFTYVADGLSA